jgi:glycerol uptake facilitator-like aquaporin
MKSAHARAYLAECLGAFILSTCVVILSSSSATAPMTPVLAGLTLMLLVYILGPISGAHVNPAITIAQWSVGRLSAANAVPYFAAQLVGGGLAFGLLSFILPAMPSAAPADSPMLMVLEALGAGMLSLGVYAATSGRATAGASGFTVGGSLLLGALLASIVSSGAAGVLNPAVAVSLRFFTLSHLIAPVVGAVAAAWLYRFLINDHHQPK